MFHFRIISCTDLPIKDANGLIDSYVVLETKGKDEILRVGGKTKVARNNRNPVYSDQVFDIPSDDCFIFKFSVYDEDVFKDCVACWIQIKTSSILDKLGQKITKDMNLINPENHTYCHPKITFIVELDGKVPW